ncbi:sugar transferase [Candidatus Oleimmundimicrobium sp.]|uniref:sugar transferase n=1 Tax=Candidatus Oleimmundimicrobium sp. TaxID=3060597 RepID=UPI00271D7165|nr:sugar transferase [Candidatus Oleimmundimicrobium sp.]MDO8885559.1 sugar transferase [Candidatus Oleimmundimicrobium sp.]
MDTLAVCLERSWVVNLYLVTERFVDILGSAVGLMLLSPVMLLVSLGIKLSSPGPVFFRQKRAGMDGKLIDVIKFRTMYVDAEDVLTNLTEYKNRAEPFVKLKKDPRVFHFGQLIRKTSIDEIPQLLNILWGQMSFVGPRPLVPCEMEHCNGVQLKRLYVKPGLTGLAQIEGRTDITFEKLMALDLEYVKNRSLWMDAKILFKTVVKVMRQDGAY